MHGVLGVIPVDGYQLRPVGVRACLPGHRRFLSLQVAEIPAGGQPGDEAVGITGELGARLIAEDHLPVGNKQHQ